MAGLKVAVFTGGRAEYGLLVPVMGAIAADPALELLVISGSDHVSSDAEAFPVAAQVPIARADETPASTPRAIGAGVTGITDALERLAPDVFLVYGDRFEAFAALIASTQMGLPTAHLEGGDLTQGGTLDDVVRHAMTKLAHIHLPTNAEAAARLQAMGEEPWRITQVGFPPIDLIRAGDFTPRTEVLETLGLDALRPIILFTQHSISTAPDQADQDIAASLAALERAQTELGAQVVLTYPNGDIGSDAIITALQAYTASHDDAVLCKSLGRRLYHGLLQVCGDGKGVCVGNSSSGLKETPAFNCPAVDIGPRQTGRLRGINVLHVPHEGAEIFDAIRRSVEDEGFRAQIRAADNPYGQGNSGAQIARVLKALDLKDPRLLQKQTCL